MTTAFHYDGLDAIRENGAAGEASYLRTLAIDEALIRTDATGTSAYLTDTLGSTLALTDASGSLATDYTHDPFGQTSVSGFPSSNPFQFTGRENDGTGLYYYRGRQYDPKQARFLSEDPIGLAGGDVNLYRYVWNQPTNLVDPLGLWGFGGTAAASAEAGVVAIGAGATASAGAGVFGGGTEGLSVGAFGTAGGFVGGPGYGVGYPSAQPGGTTTVGGAFAGAGLGGFITNATNVGQLSGPFNTYSLNIGVGPIQVSIQVGEAGGIWIGSATVGPGLGISGGGYPTNTWTRPVPPGRNACGGR
jgi:RHS repeat-associated protein